MYKESTDNYQIAYPSAGLIGREIYQQLKEEPIMENNTTNIKSFHYLEDDSVDFSILKTKYTTKKLDSAVYDLGVKEVKGQIVPDLKVSNDKEHFNEELGFYYEDKIKNIYSKFFMPKIKQKVNSLGYNHKLGILLYGKQGTGKTSMLKKYFDNAVSTQNAIVFNITSAEYPKIWWKFVQDIRKIQTNPIVIFLDEFDEFFGQRDSHETDFKRMLDGTDSIDNTLFLMTTNYIDKIPQTIKDRPSRIKYAIEVEGIQDELLIAKFLKQSFDKIDMEVDFSKDISKMKGNTIDELKQYVLDKVMDLEPEEKNKKKLGF
jgi:ATP-dependent 26S proteasome regulatory subunit